MDEILVERSKLSTQNKEFPLVSFTVENGVTAKTDRYDREALVTGDKSSKKYKITQFNDIVYNPANLKFGAISRNKYGNAVFSPIYVTLEVLSNQFNASFIEYIVRSKPFIDKALRYQQGTVYERQSVNVESFLLQVISVPTYDEQMKISSLLESIDNLITLHQRKLENLKLKKKALLQKLFPKNGEQFPELRFPGFTDAWEQRKSEDIFKSITDKGHSGLAVLSASQEWGMIRRDEGGIDIQHDKANENTYKRVLPGQFVIHLRSFQGGFAYSEIEGITSPAYTVIDFKNQSEHYPLFWKHVFKSSVFIKRLETITYGIRDGRSISFSDFKTLSFRYPTLDEQKNIADSIEVFEKYITLHQRKYSLNFHITR